MPLTDFRIDFRAVGGQGIEAERRQRQDDISLLPRPPHDDISHFIICALISYKRERVLFGKKITMGKVGYHTYV